MYVCICRGITDTQVNDAVCNGARCVREVNQCIGIPVQCGKCCQFMKQIVNQAVADLHAPQD